MGYASDLTDKEWALLQILLPRAKNDRRYADHDLRQIINGLLYVDATGEPWSQLPADFPAWELVYHYAHRWARVGRLRKIAALLGRGPKTMPKVPAPKTRRKSVTRAKPESQPHRAAPVLTQEEIEARIEAVKAKRGK